MSTGLGDSRARHQDTLQIPEQRNVPSRDVPAATFATSSVGISGALMSLVILALLLILLVTLVARYLHARPQVSRC